MAIFKNAVRLAIALLGTSVAASAISLAMAADLELPKPHELTGGPSGDLLANMTQVICQPTDYVFGVDTYLDQGITYLQGKDGTSRYGWLEAAPAPESRALKNSAIYVCNDNEYSVNIYYDTMATYAQYLVDYVPSNPNDTACTQWLQKNVDGSPWDKMVTSGQLFDSNGFNIVVGMLAGTNC